MSHQFIEQVKIQVMETLKNMQALEAQARINKNFYDDGKESDAQYKKGLQTLEQYRSLYNEQLATLRKCVELFS